MRLTRSPLRALLVLGAVCLLAQRQPELMEFDRAAIATQREVWRLFSAQFAHYGFPHAATNLLAVSLCVRLWMRYDTTLLWLWAAIGSGCITNLALLAWHPEYSHYRGFSGAIHGLIATGAFVLIRKAPITSLLVAAGLAIKLCAEEFLRSGHSVFLPAQVATAYPAHLYGALAGGLIGLVYALVNRTTCSNRPQAS